MSGPAFFLEPGSEAHAARRAEIAEREEASDTRRRKEVAAIEALLADDTREGQRLVDLARLLDAEAFSMRERAIARADEERRGPRGNDLSYQRVIFIHESTGRLSVKYALTKAEAVLALVRSWQ